MVVAGDLQDKKCNKLQKLVALNTNISFAYLLEIKNNYQ